MNEKIIDQKGEYELSTEDFQEYLKQFQDENDAQIPVILKLTAAQSIRKYESFLLNRTVNITKYGNDKMIANSFYKPISSIIKNDSK